jgi:hypothetical protein
LIVSVAVDELLFAEAVIVALTLVAPCCDVETWKVAEVAPAATLTVEPTVAELEFDESDTVNAFLVAADRVTVPVLGYPA